MRVKLEDVCEQGSSNVKQSDIPKNKGLYEIYGASGLAGKVDFYHRDKPYVAVVKDGAGIGRTMFLHGKTSVIGTLQYLIPKDNILPKYLYYVVKYMNLSKYFTGATIPHIYYRDYKNEEFNLSSIDDQKTIVNQLEALECIIELRTEELKKLDELVKARFVEMFGTREKWNDANWKITSIDEIIEKPKSGEWGQKDESGRGIGVIRTTNFSDRGAVYFNSITTRDIPREKLITKGIKNGDILIEKSGGSDKKPVGRVVLYTGESNKYLNNNFTAILRINNNTEVNNIFLFTFLYINYWQGGTKVFESKTTGIHNLNLKEFLNKTKIAIPDMLLQNQFATFVAQIDKSKFALSNELAMGNFYIRLIHDCIMHGCIDL